MSPEQGHRGGWPLSWVVGLTLVLLLAAATGMVAGTGYQTAQRSTDLVWRSLADNVADRTTGEVAALLQPAMPLAALGDALMAEGDLDPADPTGMLTFMEHALDANPGFTWISFSDVDGRYTTVYRWPVEDRSEIRSSIRTQVEADRTPYAGPLRDPPVTLYQVARRVLDGPNAGQWEPLEDELRSYDPRVRPFYLAAQDAESGIWVDPFIFVSRQQPGVSYALASRTPDGELRGIWSIEFECEPLSVLLADVEVSPNGRVYVLSQNGAVVGHPGGKVADLREEIAAIWQAEEHPDLMLREAWNQLQSQPASDAPFVAGDNLVMARPFDGDLGLPWLVLTVVPRDDFFAAVDRQAQRSMAIAGGVVLLALVLSFVLSRILSRPFAAVRTEMYRMAHFDLREGALPTGSSPIREVNDMSRAAHAMKQGLRSFGKYVPRELVLQLMQSEREAGLEAENREITILFTDIAGFTPIVESTPPAVMVQALQEYLEALNAPINDHGGTVVQYLGDAVMALWGAPRRSEDHAVQACRAALVMKGVVDQLLHEFEGRGWPGFPTRFGIQTGEVMVGNIGARNRFNYGCLGDPVNTAARLEGLNKLYQTLILVGGPTAAQVGDQLVLREVDTVRVKGRSTGLSVYEVFADPSTMTPEQIDGLASYAAALALYRAARFEEAAPQFAAADALLGGDGPSQVMGARCTTLLDQPPQPGWDGAYVMHRK